MKLTYREEEMEETDEGGEMERCGEEAERMKKRDDQGSFRRRAGGCQTSHLSYSGCVFMGMPQKLYLIDTI